MELTKIKGVSEKRNEEFLKMGIKDTSDLINFFPRAYLDLREKQSLRFAYHNDVVLTSGKIVSIPVNRFMRRGGYVKAVCEQEGLIFSIIWFNQPYVLQKLKVGEDYLFYGRVQRRMGELSLINPSFELCEKVFRLKGIVPQYQAKSSLSQKLIRDAVKLSVNIEKPKTIIPQDLVLKYNLSDLFSAYREVHNPNELENIRKASDRIAVEEYFKLIMAFRFIKGDAKSLRINKYGCTDKMLLEFISRYPFEFTDGQKSAVNEIFADMKSDAAMNRLLQGDVGSGKTAVGNCAIFIAVSSGYQAVMLAPTEVLARQNYQAISKVFPDYNVALITGSMTAKEKKEIKAAVKEGQVNILVGTHALLQDDVEFKKLSLCVCDEQQRFGVAQRSALLGKGIAPDVLVMSATPIPRTLSLIFYGDLNITTISDKPKSRLPIQTNFVPQTKYNDMLGFIEGQIREGRQAYFVCPKIDGDEEGAAMSATELYEDLKEKMPSVSIGLMHGQMKGKEKEAVMRDFAENKIQALVSTTVIEVGVDVPNTSVMVIYDAERFGLSQLHQLRGRVGRSDIKSYCFLLTKSTSEEALERIKIIQENTDGFKISEYDYKLRGSGDFMGTKQSGKFMSDLGFLVYDTSAIFLAKKIADEVFEKKCDLSQYREIAIRKYNKLKDVANN